MKPAIFINTFLRDDLLYRCVDSCLKYIPNSKLYITDNGRQNQEKDLFYSRLEEQGHFVEIKDFNYPWRKAFDEKIDKCTEDFIMKVDDDMYFTEPLDLTIPADAGLMGGKVWHEHRGIPSPYIYNIEKTGERRYTWTALDPDIFTYCDVTPDFWIARREIFNDFRMDGTILVGQGGHEVFFMDIWHTDKDWRVVYNPNIVAMHEKGSNTEEYKSFRWGNPIIYQKKYGKIIRV